MIGGFQQPSRGFPAPPWRFLPINIPGRMIGRGKRLPRALGWPGIRAGPFPSLYSLYNYSYIVNACDLSPVLSIGMGKITKEKSEKNTPG